MALSVADLLDDGSTHNVPALEEEFYDPRGFTTRRRSSLTSRPNVRTGNISSSPIIDIPGAHSSRPAPAVPLRKAENTGHRPPELSISPDGQGTSSGSEVETPSQVLSRSIEARLQFDLSPPETQLRQENYFVKTPSDNSPTDHNKGILLPPLRSHDSDATVKPESSEAGYVRSTWRYSKAGLSLGHYATAPAEPGVPASRFASARARRESPKETGSGSSSRSTSEASHSPAQAYLSNFSRGTSLHSLNEAASDAAVEVVHGYAIGKAVGYGGFSSVRQARHIETGVKVAVKVLPARSAYAGSSGSRIRTVSTPPSYEASSFPEPEYCPDEQTQVTPLDREVKIWSKLRDHPHILPLLDLHTTLGASYIFMPFCPGGNLLQYIQEYAKRGRRRREQSPAGASGPQRASSLRRIISPVEEPEDPGGGGFDLNHVRHIFAQIVDGLRYLHIEAEVTHKDIKLENILLDEAGYFRIADFGLAVTRTSLEHPRAHSQLIEPSRDLSSSWNGFPSSMPSDMNTNAAYFGLVQVESPNIGAALGRNGSLKRYPPDLSGKASLGMLNAEPTSDGPEEWTSRNAGSLAYAAPELLGSSPSVYSTGSPAVDMWALGCVLYALLDGRLPFHDEYEPRLRVKICEAQWAMPAVLTVKPPHSGFALDGDSGVQAQAVIEVLRGCLEPDPLKRWTIEEVKDSDWLTTRWPSTPGADAMLSRRQSKDILENDERKRSTSRGRRSTSRSGSKGRRHPSGERPTPY